MPQGFEKKGKIMEFDISKGFAEFLINAIDCYLEAFPEYQKEADAFLDVFCPAQDMGCPMHLNFKGN